MELILQAYPFHHFDLSFVLDHIVWRRLLHFDGWYDPPARFHADDLGVVYTHELWHIPVVQPHADRVQTARLLSLGNQVWPALLSQLRELDCVDQVGPAGSTGTGLTQGVLQLLRNGEDLGWQGEWGWDSRL